MIQVVTTELCENAGQFQLAWFGDRRAVPMEGGKTVSRPVEHRCI